MATLKDVAKRAGGISGSGFQGLKPGQTFFRIG